MDVDVRGYNPEKFVDLGNTINTIAEKAVEEIGEKIQNGLYIPISTAWYTQEGKDYFHELTGVIRDASVSIYYVYKDFRDFVQQAGEVWAENTKNPAPDTPSVHPLEITGIDDSIIEADFEGNVIIDESAALAVANNLGQVKTDIINRIQELNGTLEAKVQFIGGGQAEAVKDLFVRIVSIIDKLFTTIIGDGASDTEGDSIYASINRAVKKQREVAEDIADSFKKVNTTGEGSGVSGSTTSASSVNINSIS